MIGPTGTVKVMVATKPVDFRKGAEGLAALVREQIGADPFGGTVFVFRAKRMDRVKLIFWDGTGICLFAKRLRMASSAGLRCRTVMRLTAAQLSALLEGLDWRRVHQMRRTGFRPSRIAATVNQAAFRPRRRVGNAVVLPIMAITATSFPTIRLR